VLKQLANLFSSLGQGPKTRTEQKVKEGGVQLNMKDLLELAGQFKLAYLDPPWMYTGDPDKDQAAGKHYNEMSYEELAVLPVRQLIDDPGVLFMWATSSKLDQAVDLIREWDFFYRGIGYIWIKTAKDGHVIEGQGVRPSFVKPTTELVLIGSTKAEGRTLPIFNEGQSQLVFAPRGEHSEKPIEVRERIEELFGDIPRIELFARKRYSGWTSWGLEADRPMSSSEARSPKLQAKLREVEEQEELRSILEGLPQD